MVVDVTVTGAGQVLQSAINPKQPVHFEVNGTKEIKTFWFKEGSVRNFLRSGNKVMLDDVSGLVYLYVVTPKGTRHNWMTIRSQCSDPDCLYC